jgi:hypothetical protein
MERRRRKTHPNGPLPIWRGVFSIDADIFLSIETIALYIIRYRR